jgi:acetyl/propionyl-CoA carboxylase alpha subunit
MYREPTGPGIRVDSGVVEGTAVSVFYDPLLAKLIAYGETRAIATARLRSALDEFIILGIHTNIPLLRRVLRSEQFASARVHTGFLEQEGAHLVAAEDVVLPPAVQAALKSHAGEGTAPGGTGAARFPDPFESVRGWSVR